MSKAWKPLGDGQYDSQHRINTIIVEGEWLKISELTLPMREIVEAELALPHDIRLCQLVNVDVDTPQPMPDDVARAAHQMLDALKMAYRKHHLEDTSVGWNELSSVLHNALCEAMGDESFVEWLDGLASDA